MDRHRAEEAMTTKLTGFTQLAQKEPRLRFNSLMGLLFDPEGLFNSFDRQAGNKAPGVDGIRKKEYAEGVFQRLAELSGRVRSLSYKPKPARRVYIPKGNGGRRPLGIPSFEDRIVQDRLSQILQAIWEPEFQNCSYGFRPGRNAHQALLRVGEIITYEKTQWVVEADIKGFFNHVSHDHLMRFLKHRIADPMLVRIIQRFLKAGVMEDGVVSASEEGTPQGGLVSPVLANIYLHYVLDLWFEKRYARTCRGKASLVRFADDFIACFQDEKDAQRFLVELQKRLADFNLKVEPTKTAVIRFGNQTERQCGQKGQGRPQTFNFLGFTHYVTRSHSGRFAVGRKTEGKRIRRKLKEVKVRLMLLRTQSGKAMKDYIKQHLQGHIQYYGVSGNIRSLRLYVRSIEEVLFKWLNRRSQRRTVEWEKYSQWLKTFLPPVRIVHNLYPKPPWMT